MKLFLFVSLLSFLITQSMYADENSNFDRLQVYEKCSCIFGYDADNVNYPHMSLVGFLNDGQDSEEISKFEAVNDGRFPPRVALLSCQKLYRELVKQGQCN